MSTATTNDVRERATGIGVDQHAPSRIARSLLRVKATLDAGESLWTPVIMLAGGYAITIPGSDEFLPPPPGSGEIDSLYLRPEANGKGLGRTLLDHSVRDLRDRGFEPQVLWAFEANDHARGFYERMGWRFDGSLQHWVLDGIPVPIVRYQLEASAAADR